MIGFAYKNLGEYTKVLEFYNRALEIYVKVKGDESIEAADTLSWIGFTYKKLGEYTKTLEFYNRALEIYTKK